LIYARIFVGYDDIDDPSEYTIFIKHVILKDNSIIKKYGKNKSSSEYYTSEEEDS